MPTSSSGRWYEDLEVTPRADVASNTIAAAGTTFSNPFASEDALAFLAVQSVTAASGTSPTITTTLQTANDPPNVGSYSVQTLTQTATGGTFTLTYSGQTTSALAYNATGAQIQAALAALSNVGVGANGQPNVIVTGAAQGLGQSSPGGVAVVTWAQNLPGSTVATVNGGSLTGGSLTSATISTGAAPGGTAAVQSIHSTGALSAGNFTLTFDGNTTASIPYNATTTQVQSALAALPNVGTGMITVTGGQLTTPTDFTLTFKNVYPYHGPVPAITVGGSVTGGTLSIVQTTAGVAAVAVDWYDVKAFALQNAVGKEYAVFGPLGAACRWKFVVGGTGPSVTFNITGTTEQRRS